MEMKQKKKREKGDGNGGEVRGKKKTKENKTQKRINPAVLLGTLQRTLATELGRHPAA